MDPWVMYPRFELGCSCGAVGTGLLPEAWFLTSLAEMMLPRGGGWRLVGGLCQCLLERLGAGAEASAPRHEEASPGRHSLGTCCVLSPRCRSPLGWVVWWAL